MKEETFSFFFRPSVEVKHAEKCLKFVNLRLENEKREQSSFFHVVMNNHTPIFVSHLSTTMAQSFEAKTCRLSQEPGDKKTKQKKL